MDQLTPNYIIRKGLSYTLAPRIVHIKCFGIKFNFPKLIKVNTIYFIDYRDKTDIESVSESALKSRPYPLWITGNVYPDDHRFELKKMLCPSNKTDEVVTMIDNIPSKIGVLYGPELKESYNRILEEVIRTA